MPARAFATALTFLLLGACAARPAAPGAPSFAASALREQDAPVAAADLVAPAGAVRRLAVVRGDAAGREVVERFIAADGGLVREESRDGKVVARMHLVAQPGGAFALREVESLANGSRSVFADPLPFAADIAAGSVLEGRSAMAVRTIPGDRPRASGTGVRSLRVLGRCEIDRCGERLQATVVELRFTADLDMARADVVSRLYVVAGRGVVAEERSEKRVILGILPSSTDETAVLLDATAAEPAP
ncbi:MAG: hypothetical protein ACKOYN_02875 [Planctomycetota bacterium]